jgi:hypothetical protein
MFPDLEAALGCKLPSPTELHTEEARQALDRCRLLSFCLCCGSRFSESGFPIPVLRIRDILVRIQIRGSVHLTNGSGFS